MLLQAATCMKWMQPSWKGMVHISIGTPRPTRDAAAQCGQECKEAEKLEQGGAILSGPSRMAGSRKAGHVVAASCARRRLTTCAAVGLQAMHAAGVQSSAAGAELT